MRKYFLIMLTLLACSQKKTEYSNLNTGISYKYIQFGEGNTPSTDDVLKLTLTVTSIKGDTLHYVPDYNYYVFPQKHTIDSTIRKFKEGDSLILKVKRREFNSYLKFNDVLQSDSGEVFLHLRLKGFASKEAAVQSRQAELSERETMEQIHLKKYLRKFKYPLDDVGRVYRQMLHEKDSGEVVKFGSELSIHYIGYFLNGYVFDNTYEKPTMPSFTFGREYQMIEGLQTAINGLKEGERVKIILPSRHAFGGEGSLAGIVPPYTTVIYEVNIIKVIN